MSRGVGALFNGIVGLCLSIVVWRLTHSASGWAALFAPAALLLVWGLYRVFWLDDV